jgi:hypothetical protein
VSKLHLFWLLGLAFERKADAQVIVNKEKWKEVIEGLEVSRRLPKHLPTELPVEHLPCEQVRQLA